MRGHTDKMKVETMFSDRYDIDIHTNGGDFFTVSVIDYVDTNQNGLAKRWKKSFRGDDAQSRAFEYSRSLIHEEESLA